MGFFDKTTKNQTTNVDNTLAVSDNRYFEDAGYVEGNITISGDGNQITRTDYGAITAARDSAALAFDAVVQLNQTNADTLESVNYESLDFASEVARDANRTVSDLALTSTELAIDAANDFSARSFDALTESQEFARDLNYDSLDFASTTFTDALNAIERDASASRQQTANEISKAYDLAATHSRSEGGEAMDKAVKVIAYGGLGLGLLFIGSQLLMKKG
ncbi:hypothetical protein P886_2028 [Alteromonadaceae bacterium 2753L.S.0a.02]|nr:hypothetical protein P886_2028 [Alteromonadaceae bacterium 2753L.S.0a.02]